jgi:hypothetical protein
MSVDDYFISTTIVDTGYAASAFFSIMKLDTGKIIEHRSFLGIPKITVFVNDHPREGASAWFRGIGARISLQRPLGSSKYKLFLKTDTVSVDAELDASSIAPLLSVTGAAVPGTSVFTQKTNLIPVKGKLLLKGKPAISLDGGLAGLDYTRGCLPRYTNWRWATSHGKLSDGTGVGFNLADGNNLGGQNDNALWIGNKMFRLQKADFQFDPAKPASNWKISTDDGVVDLEFSPRASNREDRNLVLVESHFAQFFGYYSGTIKDSETGVVHKIVNLPGATENQNVKW